MSLRSVGRVVLVASAMVLTADAARACTACFGAEDSPLLHGARLGVWLLGGVTVCVQAAFVAFFLYLRKRSKLAGEMELEREWAALQRGEGGS